MRVRSLGQVVEVKLGGVVDLLAQEYDSVDDNFILVPTTDPVNLSGDYTPQSKTDLYGFLTNPQPGEVLKFDANGNIVNGPDLGGGGGGGDVTQGEFDSLETRVDALEAGTPGGTQGSLYYGVSVKAFGAAGDGVADDTTEIQAAIDAVNEEGGGVVFFPAGVYMSNKVHIYSNVILAGEGVGASVLKLRNGQNTALVESFNFASDYAAGGNTMGIADFAFRDMCFDGNKVNNPTGGYVIQVYGYGYSVNNIKVRWGKAGGVFSSWGTSPNAVSMEAQWNTFWIENCDGDGLHWEGPHDSSFTNGKIWTLGGGNQMDHAIWTGGNAVGESFNQVHTWGKQVVGWRIEKRAQATLCVAEGAYETNVWFVAHQTQWKNSWIYGTNGNGSNNASETAARFGDPEWVTGTADCHLDADINGFATGGALYDFQNSFSNIITGIVRINGSALPSRTRGTPNNEHAWVIANVNRAALEWKTDPQSPYLTKSTFTAKGDFVTGTANGTVARVPIGANGLVPIADATTAAGWKWGLPSLTEARFGLDQPGTSQQSLTSSVSYVSRFQAPVAGDLTSIVIDFAGGGSAGSGTQAYRAIVYSDNAGAPNTLLGVSADQSMTWATERDPNRVIVTLQTPITLTASQWVWLGWQGGSSEAVISYGYNSSGGTGYRYRSDTFTGGADATWTGGTTVNGQVLSVTGIIALADGGTGLTALDIQDNGVTEGQVDTVNFASDLDVTIAGGVATISAPAIANHETRIDALEAAPGGGGGSGGGIVTTEVHNDTVDPAEQIVGDWIDTGASSGGVFITGTASGAAAGTLYLEQSTNASAATLLDSVATHAVTGGNAATLTMMSTQRYVRVRFLTGGTGGSLVLHTGHSVTA
jgi:hypothetical protein